MPNPAKNPAHSKAIYLRIQNIINLIIFKNKCRFTIKIYMHIYYSIRYDAPTIKVFPGEVFKLNKSSDVIVNFSTFGIPAKNDGLPPTAIKIYLAVTVDFSPFAVVS